MQSVPLMLLAVQQLLDALLALGITHKLLFTQQPQNPQQPQGASSIANPDSSSTGAEASNSRGSSDGDSGSDRSPEECMQWQQQLELVQPIHGSFCRLLGELAGLVVLVQQHVRQPSEASRAALKHKVSSETDWDLGWLLHIGWRPLTCMSAFFGVYMSHSL